MFRTPLVLVLILSSWLAQPSFGRGVETFDEKRTGLEAASHLSVGELKNYLSRSHWKGSDLSEHPWQGARLTSPLSHDPRNFLYVVTGLRQIPQSAELFSDRAFASASLISNESVRSYANFGFILEVEPDNVIATWVTDGQTNRVNPWAYRENQGVLAPNALINRTGWWYGQFGKLLYTPIYNEVLLDVGNGAQGSRARHRVQVVGLYVIREAATPPDGYDPVELGWEGPPLTNADLQAAEALARRTGLPLVKISRDANSMILNRD